MPDAHQETLNVLTNYVFRKIDEGRLADARRALTALIENHANNPRVLWINGILSDNQNDVLLAAKSLLSYSVDHTFQYNIVPEFPLSNKSNDSHKISSPRNIYRKRLIFIPTIIVSLGIVLPTLLRLISIYTGIRNISLILITVYIVLILHDLLSVQVGNMVLSRVFSLQKRIELRYWTLLLTSARASLYTLFRDEPRPDPYHEVDSYTISLLQNINAHLSTIRTNILTTAPLNKYQTSVSMKALLLLRYGNYSIEQPLTALIRVRNTETDITLTERVISKLATEEQRTDQVRKIIGEAVSECNTRSKDAISGLGAEFRYTTYLFDFFSELYTLIDGISNAKQFELLLKKNNWHRVTSTYQQNKYISNRLGVVNSQIQKIGELRVSASNILSELTRAINELGYELQEATQENEVYIDDFKESHKEWQCAIAKLNTLQPTLISYTKILLECEGLSLQINLARGRFRKRSDLLSYINQTTSTLLILIADIRKRVREATDQLNFSFNITTSRIEHHYEVIANLPPIITEIDEAKLSERVNLLIGIKSDLGEVNESFGRARIEYIMASAYEDLAGLIENLLALINKHDLDKIVAQNSVLFAARKSVNVIRSMKIKSEDVLDKIVTHFNAANKLYRESSHEIKLYISSESIDIIKKVINIKKTTHGWKYTERKIDVISNQVSKLRTSISKINENTIYDADKIILLDKAMSIYTSIVKPHREYIEQLEILADQYRDINWRIKHLLGSRGDRIQEPELRSMISDAQKYLENASTNGTFGGVKDSLSRADGILNNLASSMRYQAKIDGDVYGFALGDNAKVINNIFQAGGKPTKQQIFEIGWLCAILCLKESVVSKRGDSYASLMKLLAATGLVNVFPSDVLAYLGRDNTIAGLRDTLLECSNTRDVISVRIHHEYGKRVECDFRVGFDLHVSRTILEKFRNDGVNDMLLLTVQDLWGAFRSTNRRNDRDTTLELLTLIRSGKNMSLVLDKINGLQKAYIQKVSKATEKTNAS